MNNLPPDTLLTAFILEKIEGETIERRIALYRSIAFTTGDKQLASDCRSIADELEASQRAHRQMALNFTRRAT